MRKFPIYFSYCFYFLFVLGLSLHTSLDPRVLGRYSVRYALLLLCYAVFFLPYVKIVNFVFGRFEAYVHRTQRSIFSSVFRVFIYVIPILLCLAPFEIYFRIYFDDVFNYKNIEAFHPFLQAAPIKNDRSLHINSHGFRGDEMSKEKPEGTYRIFVLGGSTVFSGDQPFEQTHCRILENLLAKQYPNEKIEVLNAGYEWYSSEHSLIHYLFKIRDFEPDLIILCHGINDLYRSFAPKRFAYGEFQTDYSHFFGPVSNMVFKHFRPPAVFEINLISLDYLFEMLRSKLSPFFVSKLKAVDVQKFPSLDSFERNMAHMVRHIKMDGVKLILATQPFLFRSGLSESERKSIWMPQTLAVEEGNFPNIDSMNYGMDLFNEKTKSIAREHGVPLLDLEAKVPKTSEFFWDDCHYTEKGNELVAREIFGFLVENNLITS